jgi:hypothetical protein
MSESTDPGAGREDERGFGLEEIGIPGRKYLASSLASCSDPMKAIEEFQVRTSDFRRKGEEVTLYVA